MLEKLRWIALAFLMAALAGPAQAQGGKSSNSRGASQVPRYTPQSPTVSPYLNLLSRNGSVAGNYYGIVRPLQRQQNINERTKQETTEQQQTLQRLEAQQKTSFDQPTVKPTGTAGWFHEYGQVPPYQRTDHYYSQWDNTGGSGRRSNRR
jgi:hypothetical protein